MRSLVTIFMFLSMLIAAPSFVRADGPGPAPSGVPVITTSSATPPPAAPAMIAVATPAAPPAWAQDLMVSAQKLPVIGPIVSKGLLYLGILSAILTMLAGFFISALAALSGVFTWGGLTEAVAAVTAFQNGKFMYWIKFFSLFNAQKSSPQ